MRFYRPLLLATIAVGCLLFFWGLGGIPLLSYNEARRAIPTSGMLVSGDWLLPRVNGELYLSKPPLLYWIAATFSWLSGSVSEWTVRLPSALSATVIAIVAYRFALRQFGAWPALFAVQMLIANTTFAMFARRAEIEMLLTALCFCSLLSALHYTRGGRHRQWLWLSYFLLGAAVLAKGPVALLFVTLPLLADALCHRRPRLWQALRDPVGWAIFLVIGSSWFLAVTWRMGFGIWHAIVQKDMVEKMSGPSAKPLLMYVFWLLADFAPFCLLVFARPLATWRRKDDNLLLTLMLAVGLPLFVFSLFSNKHAKYLLPTYPLVAILFAKRLGELLESATPIVRRSLLAMALVCPVGYAAFYAVGESQVFAYRYTAFQRFSAWLGTVDNVPMYGYADLDERLIYYAKRDIPVLEESSLREIRSANVSFLLVVEGSRTNEIEHIADCSLEEFKPYLKRGKVLKVYGFGSVCMPTSQELGSRSM